MKERDVEKLLADQARPGVKDWITNSDVPIGCQFPAAVGGVVQRSRQVCRVQVGKLSARSWRVTLGSLTYVADPVDPTVGALPIIARLTFGFDGANFSADVDWPTQGGHFEVWADNVNVELVIPDNFQTDPVLPASDPRTAVLGTATIQPAASVGGPRPTRTLYSGVLAPGAFSGPIAVPRFAKALRWHQLVNLSATNAPIPVFFGGTQDAGFVYPTQSTPTGFTSSEATWPSDDGLTLHPLTRFLFVQNTSVTPGEDLSLQLEFVLDLG